MANEDPPGTYLWVGSIPPSWSQDLFRDFFSPYGELVYCYLGGPTGKTSSEQWGKLAYADQAQANLAILQCSGVELYGAGSQHWLKVRIYDWDKVSAENSDHWEAQTPQHQAQQVYLFHRFGITGNRGKGNVGWQPALPGYAREAPKGEQGREKGRPWAFQETILWKGHTRVGKGMATKGRSRPDGSQSLEEQGIPAHWSQPGYRFCDQAASSSDGAWANWRRVSPADRNPGKGPPAPLPGPPPPPGPLQQPPPPPPRHPPPPPLRPGPPPAPTRQSPTIQEAIEDYDYHLVEQQACQEALLRHS
jgi:hypothetical protein